MAEAPVPVPPHIPENEAQDEGIETGRACQHHRLAQSRSSQKNE